MKRLLYWLNVGSYCAAIAFMGIFVLNGLLTGYPWAITCYNCNICRLACPVGIDPHGFITAALANDPNYYIATSHLRLALAQAKALDPEMPVSFDNVQLKAGEAVARGIDGGKEVMVIEMKAKHVARFCFLCGNCTKQCPISLPIKDIAEDLAKNGGFR
jgi:L-lactate utilization protein LutB